MSIPLLESSALQSIILQPLVNILHDSSEMIYEVNGNHGFLMLQTHIDSNGSCASWGGRQIQDGTKSGGNFFKVLYKICCTPSPHTKKKKEPTTSLLSLLSLASFKEIKVSTLYTDRGKKTAFFQLNTHCAW